MATAASMRYFLAPNVKAWSLGGTLAADNIVNSGGRVIRQVTSTEGPKSAGQQIDDAFGKVSSLYHIVKASDLTVKLALATNPPEMIGKPLQGISDMLGSSKKVLLVPRICNTVVEVARTNYSGDVLKAAKNWVEMVGSLITGWAVFAPFFNLGTTGTGPASLACDFVGDSLDLTLEGKKLSSNIQLINQIPVEVSDPNDAAAMVSVAKEGRNINILKMCKIVASLACTILGVLGLILGAHVILATVSLVIGLASTVFAITSTFYENTRKNVLLSEPNTLPLRSSTLLPSVA